MTINKIYVQCEFKKALPNYQNVTFTAGCGADLSESDNIDECYSKLWEICGEEINEQLRLFTANNEKSMKLGK